MGILGQMLEAARSRPRSQETADLGGASESYVRGDGWDTASGLSWAPPPLLGKPGVTHPYREQPIWRAALKALASPASRLPFVLWDRDPSDPDARSITEGQPNHPLVRLWQHPNAALTGSALWKLHMLGYREGGETYFFLADLDGAPVISAKTAPNARRNLPIPAQVIPVFRWSITREGNRRPDGQPQAYRYAGQPESIPSFAPESVVRIFDHDLYDWGRGFGDGATLGPTFDLNHQASRYLGSFVRSGGDPGAWIKHRGRIGPAEKARLQAESDDAFSNTSGGSSRYRHIGGDIDIIPNPVRPRDMEYGQLFKHTQGQILALCGVPAPIIGDLERATYNNIQVVELLMWRGPNGILTTLRDTEAGINEHFLRRIPGIPPTWQYRFDTSDVEVLQKDNAAELKLATDMAARGVGTSVRDNLEALGAEAPMPEDAGAERWLASNLRNADDQGGDRMANTLSVLAAQVASRAIPPASAQRIAMTTFPGTLEPADAAAMFPDPGPAPEPVAPAPPPAGAQEPEAEEGEEEEALAARGRDGLSAGELSRSPAAPNPSGSVYAFRPGRAIEPDAKLTGLLEGFVEDYLKAQRAMWSKIAKEAEDGAELTPLSELLETGPGGQRYRDDVPESLLNQYILAQAEWEALLQAVAGPQEERIFLDALAATQAELGGGFISATDPRVLQAFTTNKLELTRTVQTLTDEIRDLLFSALTGETDPVEVLIARKLPELDEGLQRVFGTKEARANAISRTETGRAQNSAQYLQMREAGVSRVGWRHSGNPKGREDHVALNGVEVPMGQKFSNGLRHPHDPAGDAGDVVNCACAIYAAAFEDDE